MEETRQQQFGVRPILKVLGLDPSLLSTDSGCLPSSCWCLAHIHAANIPTHWITGMCAFPHSDGYFTENITFEPGNLGQPFWDHIFLAEKYKVDFNQS